MATTLRIEHLVKRFEGLVAVNDLSIDVQEREIHALIGPNGSGKTTTLNLINSVIPPTSGQIWFRDTLLTGKPTFETVKAGVGRSTGRSRDGLLLRQGMFRRFRRSRRPVRTRNVCPRRKKAIRALLNRQKELFLHPAYAIVGCV
mgnify:CR=1 FL=1